MRGLARLFFAAAMVLCAFAPPARAAGTTLNWDANPAPSVVGYRVHHGFASRTYTTRIEAGNTVSRRIEGLADGTTYYFAVTALDRFGNESGFSKEVVLTTPPAAGETLAAPPAPTGPASGPAGASLAYTVSSAVSSAGHAVQYRFSWSDGSATGWLPVGVTSALKSWSVPGVYTQVRVEARCAQHPSVVSPPSPALAVTITAATAETVSAPPAPAGPLGGVVGSPYVYTTGGAVSSAGDPVQYRFSWADGSVSEWLPAASASATKIWNTPGAYTLKVEARCALHESIHSAESPSISVTIASGSGGGIVAPEAPAGPAAGVVDVSYAFTSAGASSPAGEPLRHRFHWGDGTTSDWIEPGRPVISWKSWGVPGTYTVLVEAAGAVQTALGAFSPAFEVEIAERGAPAADSYVLWTRGDTGEGELWRVAPDPVASPAAGSILPLVGWATLQSPSQSGQVWRAVSFSRGAPGAGYVLWKRGDTGEAVVWKIDPGQLTESSSAGMIPAIGWAALESPLVQDGSWQAAGFAHAGPSEGYALWSRDATGEAILGRVDPAAAEGGGEGAITVYAWAGLSPPAAGASWRAVGYTHVGPNEGYVLWRRDGSGEAALLRIDPGALAGTGDAGSLDASGRADLRAPSEPTGVWQAAGYAQRSAVEGHVLWAREDSGQAALWRVDPSAIAAPGAAAALPFSGWQYLYSTGGIGGPWGATGFVR